jgi:hypothetical protein
VEEKGGEPCGLLDARWSLHYVLTAYTVACKGMVVRFSIKTQFPRIRGERRIVTGMGSTSMVPDHCFAGDDAKALLWAFKVAPCSRRSEVYELRDPDRPDGVSVYAILEQVAAFQSPILRIGSVTGQLVPVTFPSMIDENWYKIVGGGTLWFPRGAFFFELEQIVFRSGGLQDLARTLGVIPSRERELSRGYEGDGAAPACGYLEACSRRMAVPVAMIIPLLDPDHGWEFSFDVDIE